jgi:hypothetical protein
MRSKTRRTPRDARARRSTLAAAAAALPLAVSLIPSGAGPAPTAAPAAQPPEAVRSAAAPRGRAAPKEFGIPLGNLRDWAGSVVVTVDDVTVEGSSNVHKAEADCEIHLGAHTPDFRGDPDGLVLEPMNACVEPFPGKSEQKNSDWINFAKSLKGTTVTVAGVPRIWPEHLSGGGASNPDHAVELHPLTAVVSAGKTFDFAPNVFAGEYRGGVGEETADSIVRRTTVSVTRNGDDVEVSFSGGRIGNFTVLDIVIYRDSIAGDGAGSFRMDGEVVVDEETAVPVRIVTVKGSDVNAEMERIKSRRRARVSMPEALVLLSLSPRALLDAAQRSNGEPVAVERPLQLILYGTPDSE